MPTPCAASGNVVEPQKQLQLQLWLPSQPDPWTTPLLELAAGGATTDVEDVNEVDETALLD